jgi:molybdenum cofactor cytidylyltransferase
VAPSLPPVVILAAGRSSRLGEPKGLVVAGGRYWIERQLEAVAAAGVARTVVVLGFDRERYEVVTDLTRRATVAVNPDPDRGPFSSLQHGLAALDPDEGAFVLPIDVPAAGPGAWAALAEALASNDAAVPTDAGGGGAGAGGGHPVLLSPAFASRLRALDPALPEARLDVQLRSLPPGRVARVPVNDARIRLNLNAPEDWGRLERGD